MNETTETQNLTPCRELGYKVGDRFELLENLYLYWSAGTTILLEFDDGSGTPKFQLESDPSDERWVNLDSVKKLEPPVFLEEDIKIKIEDEEHYNKVMDILYALGYYWPGKEKTKYRPYLKYIFAYLDWNPFFSAGRLSHAGKSYPFKEHENREYVLCEDKLVPVDTLITVVVVDIETHDSQIKTEGEKDMIKQKQTHVSHTPKNKSKEKAQLVFTYTNGKKFVVRGLKNVYALIVNGVLYVTYTHETTNEVRTQESTVQVKVSNDLVTVEQINTDNSVEIVLDLRTWQPQETSKKVRGNARSKEEWEARVEAKKAKEEAAAAAREAEAQALAQQVYGLALKHGTGS